MRSYGVARGLFSFLEVVAWLGVVGGILLFFNSPAGSDAGMGIIGVLALAFLGVFLTISSLFMVALVQVGRATVDSAEYGQQSLDVARKQLAVSQHALRLRSEAPQSFVALQPADAPAEVARSEAPSATASFAALNNEPPAEVDLPPEPLPELEPEPEPMPLVQSKPEPLFTLVAAGDGSYSYEGRRIRKVKEGYLYNGQLAPTPEEIAVQIDETIYPGHTANGAAV